MVLKGFCLTSSSSVHKIEINSIVGGETILVNQSTYPSPRKNIISHPQHGNIKTWFSFEHITVKTSKKINT